MAGSVELFRFANQWLFGNEPAIMLSAIRVCTGLLMMYEAYLWYFKFQNLVSFNGYFSQEMYLKWNRKSHFTWLGYTGKNNLFLKTTILALACSGFMLAAGIFPQIAALCCFIFATALINRNPAVFDASDHIRRYFCFFLIFADTRNQLSLLHPDNILFLEKTNWPWLIRIFQIFMAHIYLKNVYFKLKGASWKGGYATNFLFINDPIVRFNLPASLQKPWFLKTTTYGTLLIETAMFTLIWSEALRPYILAAGIIFHLCLWGFLRIGQFQLTMITGLLSFFDPRWITG